jgi:hypothetical protein
VTDAGIRTVSGIYHGVSHGKILAYGDEADIDLTVIS